MADNLGMARHELIKIVYYFRRPCLFLPGFA